MKQRKEAWKQTTPMKLKVEVVSLFSSDDEPAIKKGRKIICICMSGLVMCVRQAVGKK